VVCVRLVQDVPLSSFHVEGGSSASCIASYKSVAGMGRCAVLGSAWYAQRRRGGKRERERTEQERRPFISLFSLSLSPEEREGRCGVAGVVGVQAGRQVVWQEAV